jgi:hypothetical protein
MIHHFARALAVRENLRAQEAQKAQPPMATSLHPVRSNPLRIRRDPSDTRRTVITGRFADVCAALDRLVELEAAA